MSNEEKKNPVIDLKKSGRRRMQEKSSYKGKLWLFISVIMVASLSYIYFSGKAAGRQKFREVDPEWVRLRKVTNVYDIRVDPVDPEQVWFATAEGIKKYHKTSGTWHSYGFHDGLLSEQVTAIAADSAGIWFGTWNGVFYFRRADGSWSSLTAADGLRKNYILDIEISGENLWISQEGAGVDRYNTRTKEFKHFDKRNGLEDLSVYTMEYAEGKLYCGAGEGTVYIYDSRTSTWSSTKNPESSSYVTKIWEIKKDQNTLWMATSHTGVWQYDLSSGQWRTYRRRGDAPLIVAYCLAVDREEVWAGTPKGISRYNKEKDIWVPLDIGNSPDGLFPVTALCNDEGYVWFGTFEKGLGKCLKGKINVVSYSGGMEHDHVSAICADEERLWLGYGFSGGGTDCFRKDSLIWRKNYYGWDGLPGENVSLIRNLEQHVLIGTWNGFCLYNKKSGTVTKTFGEIKKFDNEVTDAIEINSDLFIGTSQGLFAYGFSDVPDRIDETRDFHIRCMTAGEDQIYFSTARNGIYSYHLEREELAKVQIPEKETSPVHDMLIVDNALWLANRAEGIYVYSFKGSLKRKIPYTEMGNLKNTEDKRKFALSELQKIDNRIWITSNKGVAVFDPDLNNWYSLTYESGLLNNEALSLAHDSSHVYIGFFGGVNKVRKEYLENHLFIKGENHD